MIADLIAGLVEGLVDRRSERRRKRSKHSRRGLLKNFRRGFATNSSSSHSFVYLKEPLKDHDSGVITEEEFQWNDFRLDSLRAKLFYVLASRIGGGWDTSTAVETGTRAFEDLGAEFPEFGAEEFIRAARGMGVDHESRGLITVEQARDPLLVVFGGNDNDGYSQERAAAIARGEVDWSRTTLETEDEPSRDEVPIRPYDDVRFKDPSVSDLVWRTGWDVQPGSSTVNLFRYEGDEFTKMNDVPLADLVAVDEEDEGLDD